VISEGAAVLDAGCLYDESLFPLRTDAPGLGLNYIRNAVKVVIDAYNGTVSFYVADSSDPIAGPGSPSFPVRF